MGFAVCGLFPMRWYIEYASPRIIFTFEIDGKLILKSKVGHINASAGNIAKNNIVWLTYIPFNVFQQMNDDESHIDEAGNLVINIAFIAGGLAIRCGAQIVYKEDVEQCQQCSTCVSDYWKTGCVTHKGNSFVYEEKFSNT